MKIHDQRLCCLLAFDKGLISKSALDSCLAGLNQLDPASDPECILRTKRLISEKQWHRLQAEWPRSGGTLSPDDADGPAGGVGRAHCDDEATLKPGPAIPQVFSGPVLGRYRIVGGLGRGAMGAVYKAHDQELDCTVALKVLLAGELATQEEVERFRREAQSIARLLHPGIVRVRDIGQCEGRWFFTMDFIDGRTAGELIAAESISTEQALEIAVEVADALEHAHSLDILHRDVKPSNIIIGKDGRAYLTDFGLAKRLDAEDGLTEPGVIVGTLAYMPPEQAGAVPAAPDRRSDVYSLGATLYEMLTGRPVFSGSALAVRMKILSETPAHPRSIRPSIPAGVEATVLRALAKDPEARWPTAAAFGSALREELQKLASSADIAADLKALAAGELASGRPVAIPEKMVRFVRSHRIGASLAVLLLLVASVEVWRWRATGRAAGPDLGLALIISGDQSFLAGQMARAEEDYRRALTSPASRPTTKAAAVAGLGRIASVTGQREQALRWYGEALRADGANVRALGGRAILLAAQGQHGAALEGLKPHMNVPWLERLARRIERSMALHDRLARGEYVRGLVDELVEQYKKRPKPAGGKAADDWTSRPVAVCFHQTISRGDPSFYEGEDEVLMQDITSRMVEDGRFRVVEREELDRILEELRLSTSQLADPEAALQFGRLQSARALIMTTVERREGKVRVSLRTVDTETTQILGLTTEETEKAWDPELIRKLGDGLASVLEREMPIRGRISRVDGATVEVNIGRKVGVRDHATFTILSDDDPPVEMGELSIQQARQDSSIAQVVAKTGQMKEGLRVQAKR